MSEEEKFVPEHLGALLTTLLINTDAWATFFRNTHASDFVAGESEHIDQILEDIDLLARTTVGMMGPLIQELIRVIEDPEKAGLINERFQQFVEDLAESPVSAGHKQWRKT